MIRPLILTPGDPTGIGPEVVARGLAGPTTRPVVIIGDETAFRPHALASDLPVHYATHLAEALSGENPVTFFEPRATDDPVEITSIRLAASACLTERAAGLVTGPIHKGRLARRGFEFTGHTDFLGHLCGVERPVMAFVGGSLRVALVTVHLPLRDVADAITTEGVLHTLKTAHDALVHHLHIDTPHLLVCGLNPHAGDLGRLGDEEDARIAPAVERARALGIHATGPISAETAFREAHDGAADMVIAMYHDQGLVPLKLVDFGRSVNWTLGLPFVRTSVDHGTADDIVGTGRADPTSFVSALRLAEKLTSTEIPSPIG